MIYSFKNVKVLFAIYLDKLFHDSTKLAALELDLTKKRGCDFSNKFDGWVKQVLKNSNIPLPRV